MKRIELQIKTLNKVFSKVKFLSHKKKKNHKFVFALKLRLIGKQEM